MAMGDGGVAQWLLTAGFTGTGLYYLARVAAAAYKRRLLVDEGLHAVMSAAMVAMWWTWGAAVPTIGYVTAFTAATFWFVARALFTAQGTHHVPLWYHAGMMASMSWMAIAMSGASTTSPAGTGPAGPTDAGLTAMAGMDMSPADSTGPHTVPIGTSLPWITVPCLILAIAFGAATVWLASTALRSATTRDATLGWRGPAISNLAGALMAAGMAASFYEMF
jgi:hypothetical protein